MYCNYYSKILNPERLMKIKGNRETNGFEVDMKFTLTSFSQ